MSLEAMLQYIPAYVMTVFRIAGMMIFAPLFGSSRIPRRVKTMFVLVAAFGMVTAVRMPVQLPDTTWGLTAAIAGELTFGLAMGMSIMFVFIAAQWAGEMLGQQIGFNISEVLDPAFGQAGSLMGDLYFMFTLVIFLLVGGHHAMLMGVHESFKVAAPGQLGMTAGLLDALVGLLSVATSLAFRLAAPMFITMLVVSLAMGCISKTMPQFNILSAGLAMRAIVGMVVVLVSVALTAEVIQNGVLESIVNLRTLWTTPASG